MLAISCTFSARQTIHMKCQAYKNLKIFRLSSAVVYCSPFAITAAYNISNMFLLLFNRENKVVVCYALFSV